MKKLLITILAIATMALAANKPVCKETEELGWKIIYTCVRPTSNNVKKINIGIYKNGSSFSVEKIMKDGSRVLSDVYFHNVTKKTYVTEYTYDDLGIMLHDKFQSFAGDQFLILYNQMRDKYDIRRKK